MTDACSWVSEFSDECGCPLVPTRRKSECDACTEEIVKRVQYDAIRATIEKCASWHDRQSCEHDAWRTRLHRAYGNALRKITPDDVREP